MVILECAIDNIYCNTFRFIPALAKLGQSVCQSSWRRKTEDGINVRCSGIGGCPYCTGKRVCEENSLQTLSPQIAAEWDKEKNKDLSPKLVTNHASIKVWWKCAKGHSWQALVRSRTIIGTGCPVCAGKVASPAYNLATEYPDIALDWDLRKNSKPPEAYLPYSNKEVWWKCRHCGSSWKSMIIHRTREKGHCPQCGS